MAEFEGGGAGFFFFLLVSEILGYFSPSIFWERRGGRGKHFLAKRVGMMGAGNLPGSYAEILGIVARLLP